MNTDLTKIIEYDTESNILDFKKEQCPIGKGYKRNELLKDISAFANHYSNNDKFIIIGVIEKNGRASDFVNIDKLIDESKYQQLVESNIEPRINFEYKAFIYKNFKLAYFRIFNNRNRPYLMKKDIKNPVENKIDFKKGDGFIRIGTSTKKMTRTDYDKIYESKYKAKDRRSDIKINSYCKYSDDEILSKFNLKYLDLEIENTSNRYIDIDVEMKVFKNKGYFLKSEYDLRIELNEKLGIRNGSYPITVISDLNINFEDFDDHIMISRNPGINNTALSIKQNSKVSDVFNKYLYVIEENPNTIRAEIFIRSDDFTDGVLVKKIEFKT